MQLPSRGKRLFKRNPSKFFRWNGHNKRLKSTDIFLYNMFIDCFGRIILGELTSRIIGHLQNTLGYMDLKL